MTGGCQGTVGRRRFALCLGLLGALALVWILGTMPSGGPDEPVHIVRAGALVRGQLDGAAFPGEGRLFELPAWIGFPDHGCFSLRARQPATCASSMPRPTGDAFLVSTSSEYPIWGHLVAGLGTLFPAAIGNQMARVFDSIIPILLVGAGLALAARSGRLALGVAALAITPMAWFAIIVVNPSGLAIAGGFALWAGLLSVPRGGPVDRLVAWTIAAGWAAAALPRRDSMIWASLIVAIAALGGIVDLRALARRLGVGPLVVVALATVATVAWAVTSRTASSKLLVVAPLLPVAAAVAAHVWSTRPSRPVRGAIVALVVAAAAAVVTFSFVDRPGGFDSGMLDQVVGQTGPNLVESIGLLGWLDIPLPRFALVVWIAALGAVIAAVAFVARVRPLVLAAATLGVGVIGSWVLEMSQGSASGTYWQGRYYLPLLVGVPMLIGWPDRPDDRLHPTRSYVARRLTRALVVASALVMTTAFGASMRRWSVGTDGTVLPWRWDTYGTVVPPWILLVAHVVVVAGLVAVAWPDRAVATLADHDRRAHRPESERHGSGDPGAAHGARSSVGRAST